MKGVTRLETAGRTLDLPQHVDACLIGIREAAGLLERREVVCILKDRGQRDGAVYGLMGWRTGVLAFARTAKRCGFTLITDPKGLA